MSNSKNSLKSVFIISGFTALGIAVFALAITIGLKNQMNNENTSSISESTKNSEITNTSNWKENIIVSLPSDLVGGLTEIDVTSEVPCFKNSFYGESVKYSKGSTSNEFVISKEGSNLLDASRYMTAFDEFYSSSDLVVYPSSDYFHDEILPGYVIASNNHYLVLSSKSELQKQYLYIRYVPLGNEYWPNLSTYFGFDTLSMLPGMNLDNEPTITSDTNSVTIQYSASNENIELYKYTLESCFGYEDIGSGIFTNKYLNTVFIDMSVPNTLVISAETK